MRHPIMAFDESTALVFYCNGIKVTETSPDPETTLLTFLRRNLGLTGTKLGCAEGGCGACTVMVSRYDRTTKRITHIAVNACLMPLCSVHGASVTTVEGIGSYKTKLHPVQERLAKAHGSQCGFCTPGIVMSMYVLLRNDPQPSLEDVLTALEGNLCRCTGYRSIIEGYKTFCKDNCCAGRCQGKLPGSITKSGHQLFDPSGFANYDPSQDLIFPPELMLLQSTAEPAELVFRGQRVTWYQPLTFHHLLALKDRDPGAKLVAGNTEVGVEVKFKNQFHSVIIATSDIPELTHMEERDTHICVGSSVTMSSLETFLKRVLSFQPSFKTRIISALLEMLRWFAGRQVRNVASIGGNVATGSPISDLNPIFMAAECCLEVVSKSRGSRSIPLDSAFFTGYRENSVKADEVLKDITIPYTKLNEFFYAFKQSHRRKDDVAIVNAAMAVKLEMDTTIVEDIRLAYGGMADRTIMAKKTMRRLIGMKWDNVLLDAALNSLAEDLPLPAGSPGGMECYRKALSVSFFFKFYCMVVTQLNRHENSSTEDDALSSAGRAVSSTLLVPFTATQFYQEVPTGHPANDPVGKPIVHKAALHVVTGEALYVDDIPDIRGVLHMSFVISERAHAKIISVDPSKALSLPGVRHFVSACDVPGDNLLGIIVHDEELFASDEVHHVGQPIGAILADDRDLARRASKLVDVEYDDLETIITIEEAIAKQSFFDYSLTFAKGDLEEAFEGADHVLEGELKMGGQEHFYLETQCCMAVPKGEGGEMEVFLSSQSPGESQAMVAKALGIPANRITCRVKRLGGGFGGKQTRASFVASACAVAANRCDRPVRVMLDRDEDMTMIGSRHPFMYRYKIGFTDRGMVAAVQIDLFSNAGFSLDLSSPVKSLCH